MIIKLSTASVNDAIKKLEEFKKNIEMSNKDIVKDLISTGVGYANSYNNSTPSSGTTKSVILHSIDKGGTSGSITLFGKNAVYDEFGTGTEGAKHPHPSKNSTNVALNPYNSGATILANISKYGEAFWYYEPMKNQPYFDEKGKTQGIPSGKQMYNTAKDLNKIKNDIAKKHLADDIKMINK